MKSSIDYLTKIRSLKAAGNYVLCVETIQEAIGLFPNDDSLRAALVDMRLVMHQVDEAYQELLEWNKQTPEISDENLTTFRYLLFLKVHSFRNVPEELESTLKGLNKVALNLENCNRVFSYMLPLAEIMPKEIFTATINHLLESLDQKDIVSSHLARLYHALGARNELAEYFETRRKLCPENADVIVSWAYSAWQMGNVHELKGLCLFLDNSIHLLSVEGWERLLAVMLATGLRPDDPSAYRRLLLGILQSEKIHLHQRLRIIEALWQWGYREDARHWMHCTVPYDQRVGYSKEWELEEKYFPMPDVTLFVRHNQEIATHWDKNSDKLLIVFTGLGDRTGIRLELMHSLLVSQPLNVIYLKDFQRSLYLNGIQELANGFDLSVDRLREMIPSHVNRVFCYGNSAGSVASIMYGAALNVEKVLCLGPITDLTPSILAEDGRAKLVVEKIAEDFPQYSTSLRPLVEKHEETDFCLVFGEEEPRDANYAAHLAGLPNVHLEGIQGCSKHDVTSYLMDKDKLLDCLNGFLDRDLVSG